MGAAGVGHVGGERSASAPDECGWAEGGPEDDAVRCVEGDGHVGVECAGAGTTAAYLSEGRAYAEERVRGASAGGLAERRLGAEADETGLQEDGAACAVAELGEGNV